MPGEIIEGDPFWIELRRLSKNRHVVEIGAGGGQGSTTAFLGQADSLYSIEPNESQFKSLQSQNSLDTRFFPIQDCAQPRLMTRKSVKNFHRHFLSKFSEIGLGMVLCWHDESLHNMRKSPCSVPERLKSAGINFVLLDGAPYTGWNDFLAMIPITGIGTIWALDDTYDVKNMFVYFYMKCSRCFRPTWDQQNYRNGAAIFEQVASLKTIESRINRLLFSWIMYVQGIRYRCC